VPLNPATPYGLLAEFDSADVLIAAAKKVRETGYSRVEAFSPYPLPEAADALGYSKPGVAGLVLAGGIIGGCGAFFMQYWIAAIDYPINVGGRPLNSWPIFIPISFELTVLTAALAGFLGTLLLCGLPRFHHPLFASPLFARSSTDRFYLCIESKDPMYRSAETREFLIGLGPVGVEEVQP
jgi:hypothetical protein